MEERKKLCLVSHCILNCNSKVEGSCKRKELMAMLQEHSISSLAKKNRLPAISANDLLYYTKYLHGFHLVFSILLKSRFDLLNC